MNFTIMQQFINYNIGGALKPVGIVLHDTDDAGATAQNERNYFNGGNRGASAHAFVDWSNIIQTVDWHRVSWHAGPTANNSMIGIELCVPATHNSTEFQAVWDRGVWLFAYLLKNVIGTTTVTNRNIMSHAETSALWHETDHTDPISYFAEYGKTVDQFRAAVQVELNGGVIPTPVPTPQPAPVTNPNVIIQEQLNTLLKANLATDGVLGPASISAIKKFQTIMGLPVDGIWGTSTVNAVNQILSKSLDSVSSPHLEYATRFIQFKCGITTDGVFGNGTVNAVINFQKSHGLTADGVVGQGTWAILLA